nr:hypothetical protein [Rhodoplanes tepidamans]
MEDEIERLSDIAEGCRKIVMAARAAIGLGGLALAGALLGLWRGDAPVLVGAITAILGGIVVSGSNTATRRQSLAAAARAEARRAALIGAMPLTLVPSPEIEPPAGGW